MQMELKTIELNVDQSKEMYASANFQQLINSMNEYYSIIGFNKPWVGYFVFNNNQVVGTGGFTGKPKDGKVEIVYWTFKEFEAQGIASFVCKQLITIAKATDQSIIIAAKTAPENNASTKILQHNGFAFTKIVQDNEIGDAWLWTLEKRK